METIDQIWNIKRPAPIDHPDKLLCLPNAAISINDSKYASSSLLINTSQMTRIPRYYHLNMDYTGKSGFIAANASANF